MIYTRLRITVLLCFLLPLYAFTQENDSIPTNEYIEKMDDKLSIKVDVDDDIETFSGVERGIEFKVKPNLD